MCRKETLSNRTMFLIGRAALDYEQVLVFKMWHITSTVLPKVSVHGAINDCILVKGVSADELERLTDIVENDPDSFSLRRFVKWKDGSEIFRTKAVYRDAPLVHWYTGQPYPRPSAWSSDAWVDDFVNKARELPDDEFMEEAEMQICFGTWSSNGRFSYPREWRVETEEPGLGRGPEDTYQDRMAELIVKTKGAYISGRGGSGKSVLIDRIVERLVEAGYDDGSKDKKRQNIHKCAFTHVAAGNIDGHTVLHELHRTRRKGHVIIVDESSMVPLSMWSALLNLKFTGNIIIAAGDMDGQFQPIADQHQLDKLEGFDRSDFMHDLCNGLRVEMHKYRRGDDYAHYQFTGSLYPSTGITLEDALQLARQRYPARGMIFDGTTLCVSHRCRVSINRDTNVAKSRSNATLVPAGKVPASLANQPQWMSVSAGTILMAVCASSEKVLKNGLRYIVIQTPSAVKESEASGSDTSEDALFVLSHCNDDNEALGTPFTMGKEELGAKMRMTYAISYFSCQARTLKHGVRLAQTESKRFTLRHLIVGLGRSPTGAKVQVE